MIGIVGQGFVGNAIYQKVKQYYKVFTYDIDSNKCISTEQDTYNNEIVFVCLPTPMDTDGSCDTSIVEGVVKKCASHKAVKTVVIKSTVSPGTTARLNSLYPNIDVVFNPEFLTERTAVQDFKNTSRVILGGPRPSTTRLKQIYSNLFPKATIVKTDSTHAEMVKYVTNTFLSVKVSFANEIFQICDKLNIDYDKVIEYATYDERLGKSFWAVPGTDGDFGFGGHCFPKDLAALLFLSENLDTVNNVLTATQDTNSIVRKNRDWEKMKGRAVV